jgi:hypothetical protein
MADDSEYDRLQVWFDDAPELTMDELFQMLRDNSDPNWTKLSVTWPRMRELAALPFNTTITYLDINIETWFFEDEEVVNSVVEQCSSTQQFQ